MSFTVGDEMQDGRFLLRGFSVPHNSDGTAFRKCDKAFALQVPAAAGGPTRLKLTLFTQADGVEIDFSVGGDSISATRPQKGKWADYDLEIPAGTPHDGGFVTLRGEANIDPEYPPARLLALSRVSVSAEGGFATAEDPAELPGKRIERHPARMANMYRTYHEIRKVGPAQGPHADQYRYSGERNILFGDIHVHTQYSMCGRPYNGSVDDNVREAAQRGHDFVAVTDHAMHMDEESWERYFAEVREAGERHGIITIPAVEWTSYEHGHRNVYFGEAKTPPYFSSRTFETNHPKKLAAFLRERGVAAIAVPHHPAHIEHLADFASIDDSLEPLVEIYSTWASSECRGAALQDTNQTMPGGYVQDALAAGHKLGFVAGGDVHNTLAGDGGLTAVATAEPTLGAIYNALAERFCYATSGEKVFLDFHINGFPMGSAIRVNQHSANLLYPLFLAMSAACPAPIGRVEVVCNGSVVYESSRRECGTEVDLHLRIGKSETPDRIEGGRHTHLVNVSRYYYVRVTLTDGTVAWSSPIWIDYDFGWE